jgi:hypothetical protein
MRRDPARTATQVRRAMGRAHDNKPPAAGPFLCTKVNRAPLRTAAVRWQCYGGPAIEQLSYGATLA